MKKSDVFIQNFPIKTVEKLELDYDNLKGENEELIYASVTGFPHTSE